MDRFHFYQCINASCDESGVLEYRLREIPGISEPTWVSCPRCRNPMKSLREAEEDEIRSLPLLTRDGRSGPVFTTRTDAADFPRNPSSLATSLGKTSVSYGSPEYQDKDSDVIFTPEAAAILKATESRTRSLARTGVIPAFKIGKKEWRYSRTSLKEWVQEQVKGSRNATGAITESSTAKRPAKRTAVQRRKQIPTDLSPEALRKAMQSIRLNGK